MSTTKPLPTRFDRPTRDRIKRAAKKMGLPHSQVIRLGVLLILPQIESGYLKLPPQAA
jgi:antitoxin component of RelBE/YafQ-DinJ toxin-antitoxin module